MPYIKPEINRDQVMMCSFDSLVKPDSTARIIDHFINNIDLHDMGFTATDPSFEGRPLYPAANLVKLYLYGYRNNIRSSRKLAKACDINLEVIWLMDGLKPDFRTISDFRKDNISCLKKLMKEFVRRVTVDVETGVVSIDGSKFKAWNSKDRNFTITKLDDRIKWLEDHTQEYLRLIEISDQNEDAEERMSGEFTKEELEEKLKEAEERLEKYRGYRDYMEQNGLTQISLTDPDCRLMKNKNGMDTAYNIQTAVDSETHYVLDYLTTNRCTDHGLMAPTLEEMKAEDKDGVIEVIADKGYNKDVDFIKCLENGIIPNVIPEDGVDSYKVEFDYVENECDSESTDPDEISKCLHAGIIPEAYNDSLSMIEIKEVRRKVYDLPKEEEPISPYGTQEEMLERAREGFYVRDPERDLVYCPGEATLRHKSDKANGATRYVNKLACKKCPYRDRCVTSKKYPWKEIDFTKDCLEKKAKWWNPDDPDDPVKKRKKEQKYHFEKVKIVRYRLTPDRVKMDLRKCTSEHPFGTMKRAMGATYFLLKGMKKVDGEFALIATGYDIARAENMYSFEELMERVGRNIA